MRAILTTMLVALFAGPALAQEGHFVTGGANTPVCTDEGTTVTCDGKVAGLGGTTFEIIVTAEGIASVTCANPGRNEDVPGQRTAVSTTGTTGPLPTPRNGNYDFEVTTAEPGPLPPTPTCPNARWQATITDVEFTTAILSLFEDGLLVDQETVLVLAE